VASYAEAALVILCNRWKKFDAVSIPRMKNIHLRNKNKINDYQA
jgi:hypothetical protein